MDLRHHPGMHVEVNLAGMTVGGRLCSEGPWLLGVVIGVGALGSSLSVKLDTPIGGGQPHGLLRRPAPGQDLVSVELDQARPRDPAEIMPAGIPAEIVALARAGRTTEAMRRHRALNGATMDEARAALGDLAPS